MKIKNACLSVACMFAVCGAAMAQSPATNQSNPAKTTSGGQGIQGQVQARQGQGNQAQANQGTDLNQFMAHCMVLANQGEVQLAKFVQSKLTDDSVKDFAKMMAEEHQAALEKLARVAPEAKQMSLTAKSGDDQRRTSTIPQSNKGTDTATDSTNSQSKSGTANAAGRNDDSTSAHRSTGSSSGAMQLQHELAQQCLSDTQEALSKKEGNEIDKCYVGMQIVKHAEMKSKLTVFQKHATGELKEIVSEGLKTTEKHLKHAEGLMQNLAKDDSKNSTSRKD